MVAIDFAADCVTAADFDLDGIPECVLGRDESTELRVYSLLASGQVFRSQITLDSFPIAMVHGDLDLDGRPELAVATIDARVLVFVADPVLNFSLTRAIDLHAPPRDLAVCLHGSRPLLTVATTSGVEAIDPIRYGPDLPAFSQSVVEAVERLEEFAQRTGYEDWLYHAGITAREREVLSLAMRGMIARDIGSRLFIAERTVESHLAHAYTKLGVRSRFELLLRLSGSDRQAAAT